MERSLRITKDTRELKHVREFAADVLSEGGMGLQLVSQIVLAVDEAVANAILHARSEGKKDPVEIHIVVGGHKAQIDVLYGGEPFDPATVAAPDLKAHIRAGHKTGLGLFIIRQIMDKVEYHVRQGRNELSMMKAY